MKKFVGLIMALSMVVTGSLCGLLTGCGDSRRVFRIGNWEDYIAVDEDTEISLADKFVDYIKETTGEDIRVEYSTFATPEEVYNKIKIGTEYDVICPSDYMIEKMAREGMLEKINLKEDGIYMSNVSPYIKSVFENIKWGENGEFNLSQYAGGYLWGTMGIVYNSAKVSEAELNSWSTLWTNEKIAGKFTIKDSIRDTYFICLAKVYEDELKALDNKAADYNDKLTEIFNRTDAETVSKVETELRNLKNRSYGMEVDSGKNDIVTGKIDTYFAWSGDAVYAMDEADKENVELKYVVPEEGSNIWFDGWCVPKGSENLDLAEAFINYISLPENAIKNMDYIGYVSVISGGNVFDSVKSNYETAEGEEIDLGYFFRHDGDTNNYKVKTNLFGRQFTTQYPSEDVIRRCAVMSYYNDEANERINNMWMAIKA